MSSGNDVNIIVILIRDIVYVSINYKFFEGWLFGVYYN